MTAVNYRVAAFNVDVTPPLGAQMAYDINKNIDTPIFVRGLILDDGISRAVIASCDFIYIWGQAWFEWRRAIAKAAGTSAEKVFLHCIHQHDSMRIAPQWNQLAARIGTVAVDDEYCRTTLQKLTLAVRAAADGKSQRIRRLMTAERRLGWLASNRRIIDKNGNCSAMRFSMCRDPELRALPVGTIDPILRTIAFAGNGGRIMAALHFYASHPMAAYRREMVSRDVPGVALDYTSGKYGPGTMNIYLNGCGGNVTFGKYHLGDKKKSLELLGRRLGKGIVANLEHLEEKPAGKMDFATAVFDYPLAPSITVKSMEKVVKKTFNGNRALYLKAVARLVIARNWNRWRKCALYRLSLGSDIHILSLPGEMCVEYQLYAQSLVPEKFLACAAYGNGTYHYIPTAAMFKEGGYEPGAGITTPAVEARLKNAISEILHLPE